MPSPNRTVFIFATLTLVVVLPRTSAAPESPGDVLVVHHHHYHHHHHFEPPSSPSVSDAPAPTIPRSGSTPSEPAAAVQTPPIVSAPNDASTSSRTSCPPRPGRFQRFRARTRAIVTFLTALFQNSMPFAVAFWLGTFSHRFQQQQAQRSMADAKKAGASIESLIEPPPPPQPPASPTING
eukprot:GABV01009363.1.p1 GENE.GABV01009363.1~~GABV01009363.1.p1  ORF type:complete len:204 (+),score=57.50 GABV01009363.1:71-613(+)